MKKAFIFDMDGVLMRSEEFYFERRMRFFTENNLTPGSSDIDDYIGVSNEKVWENLVSEPSERERIRTKYQPFLEKNKINYQEYLDKQVPKVLATLQKQGKMLALASAGEEKEINRMLRECDLAQYFNVVISGEKVKKNKPAPDVYLETIKALHVSKDDCVVVEDSPTGILAAKRAGLEVWAVPAPVDQNLADVVLEDFGSIIEK